MNEYKHKIQNEFYIAILMLIMAYNAHRAGVSSAWAVNLLCLAIGINHVLKYVKSYSNKCELIDEGIHDFFVTGTCIKKESELTNSYMVNLVSDDGCYKLVKMYKNPGSVNIADTHKQVFVNSKSREFILLPPSSTIEDANKEMDIIKKREKKFAIIISLIYLFIIVCA